MTDPVLIFREEALRSRDAQPPSARNPRTQPPRWIAPAYWALLALMAASLAAGLLIRVGTVAQGPAVIRDGALQAVVPAAFAPDLHPGQPLKLIQPGRAPVTAVLTATGPEVADPQAASTLLHTKVSGPVGPLLLITATLPQRAAPGATGTVSIQVASQPLIVALIGSLAAGTSDG
ncbi:MAG: hypothetical protein ACRDOU_23445 [Streptosporangiaceae bacterium]